MDLDLWRDTNMKRMLASAVLLSSLAVAGTASAQFAGPGAYGYVGASIGQNNYGTDIQCIGTCDKTDIMGKIFGGYMFSPYWGVEVAYGGFGTMKANAQEGGANVLFEVKSSGFSGFLVGQYPMDNFRLFGKVGFAYIDTKVTLTVPPQALLPSGGSVDESDNSTEFAWGIGGTYMFNKNLGVRLEYEQMKYKFSGFNVPGLGNMVEASDKMRMWSIGVQYNF